MYLGKRLVCQEVLILLAINRVARNYMFSLCYSSLGIIVQFDTGLRVTVQVEDVRVSPVAWVLDFHIFHSILWEHKNDCCHRSIHLWCACYNGPCVVADHDSGGHGCHGRGRQAPCLHQGEYMYSTHSQIHTHTRENPPTRENHMTEYFILSELLPT